MRLPNLFHSFASYLEEMSREPNLARDSHPSNNGATNASASDHFTDQTTTTLATNSTASNHLSNPLTSISSSSSNQRNYLSYYLSIFLFKSLADRLYSPFKLVCFNPVVSVLLLFLLYLIFLIIFTPLWLLSFVITSVGSWAVFLYALHCLAVIVARMAAFPGSSSATSQSIATDVLKRLCEFLASTAMGLNEVTSSMMLSPPPSPSPSRHASPAPNSVLSFGSSLLKPMQLQQLRQLQPAIAALPAIALHLKDVQKALNNTVDGFFPEEAVSFGHLINALEDVFASFQTLMQLFVDIQAGVKTDKDLPVIAGRCLKHSEKLRIFAVEIYPKKARNGDGDDGIGSGRGDPLSSAMSAAQEIFSQLIPTLFSVFGSEQKRKKGFEKISFHYMRSMLVRKFNAKVVSVKGANNQRIDGVLFPAQTPNYSSAAGVAVGVGSATSGDASHSSPAVTAASSGSGSDTSHRSGGNSAGIVFFCCPNAGFYELLSQVPLEKTWCGFYSSLGYDVFMYNYRGYMRSEGSPSPSAVRGDAVKLLEYVRKQFSPKVLLVHGESIGGLSACHLAKHASRMTGAESPLVDALVCDRTFSSLGAAAERLMGSWARHGLWPLALWHTNVASDYLSANVPKVMLMDPDDAIIYHGASLCTGVAASLTSLASPAPKCSDSYKYALHRHVLRFPESLSPQSPSQASASAPAFPFVEESRKWVEAVASPGKSIPDSFFAHLLACMHLLASDPSKACAHSTIACRTDIEASEGAGESVLEEGQALHREGEDEDNSLPGGSEDSHGASSRRAPLSALRNLKLHSLLNFKVTDSYIAGRPLTPFQKVWCAAARVGQEQTTTCGLLASALSRGADGVRSWTVNALVWDNPGLQLSIIPGASGVSFCTAIAEIKQLREMHSMEFQCDHASAFVLQALEALRDRSAAIAQGSVLRQDMDVLGSPSSGLVASLKSILGVLGVSSFSNRTSLSASTAALGQALPLRCGHNGWPEETQLEALKAWLATNNLLPK